MTPAPYTADSAKPSVSVVVPVYNSAATLEPLLTRLRAVLAACASAWEVILVDDGSRDLSWDEIVNQCAQGSPCRGLHLMRNFGQHNALLAGIREATYSIIVTIDDDLQNPPEEIPKLLEQMTEGTDVVYGSPRTAGHGPARRVSSWITKLVLQRAMGAAVATKISSFRAFRTHLRAGFSEASGPAVNIDVMLSWSTTRFLTIPVRHDHRAVGASNYTIRQLTQHALNMLTGFSTAPLRLASLVGFACTLSGVGILVYVLVRYLQTGGVVPGFAFLASIITVFSGAQLFTIGIIGEYLARMYQRAMAIPPYVVRELTPPSES